MITFILCLMMSVASVAYANPLTAPAKPISSWTLEDAMALVGEDVFTEMLTEVRKSVIISVGEEYGVGLEYSPYLFAIIDSMTPEGIDPHEIVYRIGDTSPDMNVYFDALKENGYITEIPSSYTEGVANEIRKIQYAAGLPATGEITNAIARALLTDSAVPTNAETLRLLETVSGEIKDGCTREMNESKHRNELIWETVQGNAEVDLVLLSSAASGNYVQACEYIPSFVGRYQLYFPVTECLTSMIDSEQNEEMLNILLNSSALQYTLLYCAEYNLRHDFAGYAAEYHDLPEE